MSAALVWRAVACAALSAAAAGAVAGAAACAGSASSDPEAPPTDEADAGPLDLNQLSKKDGGAKAPSSGDGGASSSSGGPGDPSSGGDAPKMRFATKLFSFKAGACAGFGQSSLPQIVFGPPQGKGDREGSFDVVSLGRGGEIVLSFEPAVIVDGPGTDFVVYENAFYAASDPTQPYVEPGEVSVSEDGETWTTFPCDAAAPYAGCAGLHPVYATDEATASDLAKGGGDAFDLATVGVARARYVRIRDKTNQRCTSQGPDTNGFDLDAIGAVHFESP